MLTEQEYEQALLKIDRLLKKENAEENQELFRLSLLVEEYEDKYYPIPPPDPIEAIRFRLSQIVECSDGINLHIEVRNDECS